MGEKQKLQNKGFFSFFVTSKNGKDETILEFSSFHFHPIS